MRRIDRKVSRMRSLMVRIGKGFAAALIVAVVAHFSLQPAQGKEPEAAESLSALKPPIAKIKSKVFKEHGRRRVDNYYWLRERDNPEVIAYLKAENGYADARLAPIKPLIDEIHAEQKSRVSAVDWNPPFFDNGYYYQRRFVKGSEYQVIVRYKGTLETPEQVVLDVPGLAAKHGQFHLDRWVVSPNGAYVAFAVDFTGGRSHSIFISNIASGKIIDDEIKDVDEDIVFAADSKTLFYVSGNRVWRHKIGTKAATDALVYKERDDMFWLILSRSKSHKFILLAIKSEQTTEVRYLAADRPFSKFRLIERRRNRVRYYVDHVGDKFYIRTNLGAPDFRIVSAPQGAPDTAHWRDLIAETPSHFLSHFEVFEKFIAIDEEHDAIKSMRVFRLADMDEIAVPRSAELGITAVGGLAGVVNRDPSSAVLRFRTVGPVDPETINDFNVETGALTLRKQDPAAEWFNGELYETKHVFATAPDGETIRITVVYRKDQRKPAGNPTLVYGYGAYCLSQQPIFPAAWFSLIDRGFVYAIAHVRGGCEMGQRWYDQGRLFNKRNTFTDFIAATEALIVQGFADPKNVFARGASAGGLLMAAVANLRPDLYAGIVAEVPFVDLMTTMSDPTIPLTTFEYEEWGNPAIKGQYDYMLSYSPYDNVTARAYPAMFVTAGLYDTQVEYFEPAKWVAKLRATKIDGNDLLLKTEMKAGHSGLSGRLGSLEERAQIIAWLVAHVQ
jgi:oligopeptidase B